MLETFWVRRIKNLEENNHKRQFLFNSAALLVVCLYTQAIPCMLEDGWYRGFDVFWGFSECWPAPILPHEKKQMNNRKQESRPRCKSSVSFESKDPIAGFQGFLLPEYINNKEISALANRWLFSSRFLICLTKNVSKQFRVIDKYKRKTLPQTQWRNLLQNVRIGALSRSNKENFYSGSTVYSWCVILITQHAPSSCDITDVWEIMPKNVTYLFAGGFLCSSVGFRGDLDVIHCCTFKNIWQFVK